MVEALDSHRNFFSLDLSGNPINDSNGIKALGNLKTLRELNLRFTETSIEEVVNVLLSNNITLHTLKITGNTFNGIENLVPLGQLTDLQHLDIRGVKIAPHAGSDTLAVMLKNLTKLESLKLCEQHDNKIYWSIELANVISHHLPKL